MITQPGLYCDVPMAAYLADPTPGISLSSGCVHTLLTQSAFHAWCGHPKNPKRVPGDESAVMDIGTIAHEMLLEGSEDCAVVLDPRDYPGKRGGIPDGYTNDAIRAARDEARATGKKPVLLKDMQRIRPMVAAAHDFIEHSELRGVFAEGAAEQVAVCEEDGVWMRARPDWLTRDGLLHVSFKTTPGSAEPESFIRGRLFSLGHDTALAFYGRVIAGATGTMPSSCLLVQETSAPYACSLISLAPALADLAESKVSRAINEWRKCLQRQLWPSYPSRICYAEPKPWQLAEEEEHAYRGLADADPAQMREGMQI